MITTVKCSHIEGLIAAPLSPLDKEGRLNLKIVKPYAELLSRNGVVGAFVNGTTGEGMSLSIAERMAVAEQWAKDAPKKLKIIVHVGYTSLEESIQLAKHAYTIGAYAIGSVGPMSFKPKSVGDLVEFCRRLATSAPELPFYYYHIPSLSGINFAMRDFLKQADGKIPNLAGIKYTFETLMDFELCRLFQNEKYDMLVGRDEMLICGLVLGAKGAVGSTYNFAAPLYNNLIREFQMGNITKAQEWQRKSMRLIEIILGCSDFFSACKAIMRSLNIDLGPTRLPLGNLSIEEERKLIKDIEAAGFKDYLSK